MARANENASDQGSRDLNLTFMALSREEASSLGWPPDRKTIPGTAAGTLRKRHFTVASATSSTDSCLRRDLTELEPKLDPRDSARAAGLRYTNDRKPGILRKKTGKAFRYVAPDGKPVRDADTLGRIKSLVIPPAWTDVWISAHANGHLQATGRDVKGRKQSRYHPGGARSATKTSTSA